MKKCTLFIVFLCLIFLFGCDKDVQTKIEAENITESKPENKTECVYEPLTYKLVEPTQAELEEISDKLGIISVASTNNYNFETDNAYQYLFHWNELEYFYVPRYDAEIAKYISEPVYFTENGKGFWDNTYYEKDPLGRFGELSPRIFDENGVFDESLYYDYCKEMGNLETAGHNKYEGAFIDWLVEGVWNGKTDHDTYFEFDDTTKLYYHGGYYYSRKTEGGRGGGLPYTEVLEDVVDLGDYKYKACFIIMDECDVPVCYKTIVIGMKEASNGFRFWSIYSIQYEYVRPDDNDLMSYGIPYGLFYEYGDSVIYPEEDDYNYIRINFDESREISGYYEIKEGVIIDSNGKVYSEIEDESLLEYPGSRYPDIPNPEGVDYIYDSPYDSDILRFETDGKYGYLNTDGEIVIEAQFDWAGDFSEGLAAVCRGDNGCLEYINESGETVIKVENVDAYYNISPMFTGEPNCDFSDGLAMINGGDYYIDKEGNKIVIENACGMYKNGLVVIRDPETNLQGYADINGNIVIPCKYVWARDFLPCGVALVFTADCYETVMDAYHQDFRYCGYVNTKGEEIIPLEFYTPYYVGASGLYPMPYEQNGIISVYKEGFNYYYRYDGTLLGKRPHMKKISYGDAWYNINLAEYWQWVNDGKPVG